MMFASSTNSDRPTVWRSVRLLAATAALGLLAGAGLACGLAPGDYVVYRVAGSSTTRSVGCYYPDTEVPPDAASDSSSILTSVTLTIHVGLDGQAYLNAGGLSLEGGDSDDGYTFVGERVDVDYIGMDDDARIVTTTVVTANLITDGDAVEGTIESVTTASCEYVIASPDTSLCPSPPVPTCTELTTFVGVEIDDVTLTTDVD